MNLRCLMDTIDGGTSALVFEPWRNHIMDIDMRQICRQRVNRGNGVRHQLTDGDIDQGRRLDQGDGIIEHRIDGNMIIDHITGGSRGQNKA